MTAAIAINVTRRVWPCVQNHDNVKERCLLDIYIYMLNKAMNSCVYLHKHMNHKSYIFQILKQKAIDEHSVDLEYIYDIWQRYK